MKNLSVIIVLLLSITTANAQVELKGVALGSKDTKFKKGVSTTLIGEEWMVISYHLNDGRVYLLGGMPTEGELTRRVYKSELNRLISALENKYQIEFSFVTKDDYNENDGTYYCYSNDITYMITVEHNQFRDIPYEISLIISDDALSKIADAEEQARANQDL